RVVDGERRGVGERPRRARGRRQEEVGELAAHRALRALGVEGETLGRPAVRIAAGGREAQTAGVPGDVRRDVARRGVARPEGGGEGVGGEGGVDTSGAEVTAREGGRGGGALDVERVGRAGGAGSRVDAAGDVPRRKAAQVGGERRLALAAPRGEGAAAVR